MITGGYSGKVVSGDQTSGWVDATTFGFAVAAATPAETAPTPPPAAESQADAPADPDTPAQTEPASEASPPPASGDGQAQPLTEEEMAFVRETKALVQDPNTADQVDGDTLVRFTSLTKQAAQAGQTV